MKKEEHHIENDDQFKGLKVNSGVNDIQNFNTSSIERFKQKRKKKLLTAEEYYQGIIAGDNTILSKAITLIESSITEHNKIGQEVIEKCLPHTGKSIRLGITGVPGAGKSTTIEVLGNNLIDKGHKLAVLAIDPSSERTKGSILGDKTRMETLAGNNMAFIRPSPSAGSLGGVAQKTRETLLLCEAAGYDVIFIETVGVGQSEVAVHSMVDFFLLITIAGAGDELQGIKRGIIEMADMISINKADGDNIQRAKLAQAQLKNSLMLFPIGESKWEPRVTTHSAINNVGIEDLWSNVLDYINHCKNNDYFFQRRRDQSKYWLYESINEKLINDFYRNPIIKNELKEYEIDILKNKINSFLAARKILDRYRSLENEE
jgi:LAO/AO transport system kinase